MLREKNFVSLKKIYKLFTTMDKKSFSEFIKKIIIKTKLSKLGRKHKMSYSQSGEDLIIDFVLSVLKINKPNYLEIGSYDFRKINNTYLFYQQGLRGVCIEPDPVLYQRFKKSRPRDICLNIGISGNENGTKKFFLMKSKTLNTFSEEEAKKNEKAGYPIEKTIDIKIVSINKIIDECNGIAIDIEDSGFVSVTGQNQEDVAKAVSMIKDIVREIMPGEIFQGVVRKIMDFGAFVDILPGQSGLVHISKLSKDRVNKVEDIVKVGDKIPVKVVGIDDQGRINLSAVDAGFVPNKK